MQAENERLWGGVIIGVSVKIVEVEVEVGGGDDESSY